MDKNAMERMLAGQGLTTAQIFYHMPDFESVIQTYIWQEYDTAPDFPKLFGFLDFWERELDGALHSVQYCHRRLIGPGEWRNAEGEFLLN